MRDLGLGAVIGGNACHVLLAGHGLEVGRFDAVSVHASPCENVVDLVPIWDRTYPRGVRNPVNAGPSPVDGDLAVSLVISRPLPPKAPRLVITQ